MALDVMLLIIAIGAGWSLIAVRRVGVRPVRRFAMRISIVAFGAFGVSALMALLAVSAPQAIPAPIAALIRMALILITAILSALGGAWIVIALRPQRPRSR